MHTEQVYERSCREVVGGFARAVPSCTPPFGQAASGKTHTTQGVMRLACEQVFDEGTAEGGVRVWASYLEVYDRKAHRLRCLACTHKSRTSRWSASRAPTKCASARRTRWMPSSIGVKETEKRGDALNANASRSHAVLRLRVETDVRGVRFEATLCVVDLAGSEKPKRRKSGEHLGLGAGDKVSPWTAQHPGRERA